PARRHPRRRGGHALRPLLRDRAVQHRLPAGDQGVHRGGARRHRQRARRAGGRPAARAAGELGRDGARRPMEGRLRLLRVGARPHVPADRAVGREPGTGAGMRRVQVVEPIARRWASLPRWARGVGMLAALVFAALFPLTLTTYWQSVLFSPVGVYVLLALGLDIVVGQAGLLDLGYVAFYAVGAYTTAKLTTTYGWNPWAAIPIAIGIAMLAG